MLKDGEITIQGKTLSLKNTSKPYDDGVTKGNIIEYYLKIADFLLPHIENKPFSMVAYPDGVGGESFYQKRCPKSAPHWLKTTRIESSSETGYIDWCLVNDAASIIYMVNRGVAEMHTWFSRLPSLEKADIAVIDLDPSGKTAMPDCVRAARLFDCALTSLHLDFLPVTSGSRGLHLYIPIKPTPFPQIRVFLESLCLAVERAAPDLVTTERSLSERGDRVYLDYVQVWRGKTIAAPYSLRVRPGMPFSAPLLKKELTPDLDPKSFNIFNIEKRLKKVGDLAADLYSSPQTLHTL